MALILHDILGERAPHQGQQNDLTFKTADMFRRKIKIQKTKVRL